MPLRFNFLTAISTLCDDALEEEEEEEDKDSSGFFIEPLYTQPKPPSPIMEDLLKFLVAILSSENVKILRLFVASDRLEGYEGLPSIDPMLVSDMFCEFNSDPDRCSP